MKSISIVLAFGLFLFSCNQSSEKSEEMTPILNSVETTLFMEPAFEDENRVLKIQATQAAVNEKFKTYVSSRHFPGYVYGIVTEEGLLFSGTGGVALLDSETPVTVDTKFHIASMTKSFTAMAIMLLRDAGKLDLEDPVEKYIPEFKQAATTSNNQVITIKNLLTMTSGLPEDNPWADRQLEKSPEDLLLMLKEGLNFSAPPGSYEYSNLGFAILGAIVSKVSEATYQQYINENILDPLGLNDTYWEYSDVSTEELAQGYRWEEEQWKPEPLLHTGAFGAIGGLITSLNDYSKYVAFHLSVYPEEKAFNKLFIDPNSVREMHRMTAPRLRVPGGDNACAYVVGYGYGLGVYKDCNGTIKISHSGGLPGFGSNFTFYPEYGIGIISFINHTYANATEVNNLVMDDVLKEISPRKLPVSAILAERFEQVKEILNGWDEPLGDEIFSVNFFLDKSRRLRMKDADEKFDEIGEIDSISTLIPINQLRANFTIHGRNRNMNVFFSLDPTSESRIQALYLNVVSD